MGKPTDSKKLQGEGNYEASRRYDKAAKDFAQSGRVADAARTASPVSAQESDELRQAEQAGKSHSKGEDRPGATPGSRGAK